VCLHVLKKEKYVEEMEKLGGKVKVLIDEPGGFSMEEVVNAAVISGVSS
jgi:hypothetical protein